MRKLVLFLFLFTASLFYANAQYVTNGNASSLGGNCFQLTPSAPTQGGSVWFQNKISLASDLTISATINLGNRQGVFTGADGIAFVLQPVCNGIGGIGGGIGYFGIMPSLAVEFDTYENGDRGDPAGDHVGLMKDGSVNHNGGTAAPITALQKYTTTNIGELEDGNYHTVLIQWTASTKNLKVTLDGTLMVDYSDDIVANIFSGNRNVFWGFTAATGEGYNDQRVCIQSASFVQEGSFTVTQPTCPNFNNGAIDLNPAGGVGPFTYMWSNGATTEDISGITAGTYNVTVTDKNGCQSKYTIEVTNAPDNEPPVVTCRDVTIHLGPSPVTITALGPATSQLPAQTKGNTGFCPTPAQPVASCNCPTGYVAVGYTAETPNLYGNVVSRFTLNCRAVNPDGTFGTSTSVTCYNGTATATSSTDLAPSGEALVGFQNRIGCAIDNLQGRSKPLAAILASTPNSTNTTLTGIGGGGGALQPLQLAPDGNVIVGMQTYIDPSTGISAGYAWNYAKLEDVMRGIATASDNCGIQSATLSKSSFDCSDVGTNNVTVTVTDNSGLSTQCNFTVTVVDDTPPTAICKNATVALSGGTASITAADVNNGSTDNCGIKSLSVSKTSFTCANIGSNTVTLTVTDNNNNVSTCQATVTVVGTIPSCTITSIPTNNTYTGGNPKVIYLGYGAQSTTLKVTPTGGAPYTYAWSPAAGLSSTTSAAPVFTPTAEGNYTFTVTVTNVNGCKTTCSITICVLDIRVPGTDGKKVYVCHTPPGNPGNEHTLSISVNAVSAHIFNPGHGDHLGTCEQSCGIPSMANPLRAIPVEEMQVEAFKVSAFPNPSHGYFNVMVQTKDNSPVEVRVIDVVGRIVFRQTNVSPNTSLHIGEKFLTGSYLIEAVQGANRQSLKLLKAKQ